jgi:hypothetical protein
VLQIGATEQLRERWERHGSQHPDSYCWLVPAYCWALRTASGPYRLTASSVPFCVARSMIF